MKVTIRTDCPRHKGLNGRSAIVKRVLGAREGMGAPILQLECEGDGAHFEAMLHEVLLRGEPLTESQLAKLYTAAGFKFQGDDWYEG